MPAKQLLLKVLWAGFAVRVLVAIWNGFFGPSFGGEGDAWGMHVLAADIANGTLPDEFRLSLSYVYFLGAFYWLLTPSLFLGSLLSCVVWVVSALIMIASFRVIGVSMEARTRALFIYAVLPSSILWTSITMREPYQLLFVNVATYAALRIVFEGAARFWVLLAAAVAFGALTHASLLGWGVCLMTAAFVLQMYRRLAGSPVKLALTAVGGVALMFAGLTLFTQIYSYPIERGLVYAVNSYQSGGLVIGVRTDYRTSVALLTTVDLLRFMPVALFQYLFEPMPWRATSLADLVPLAENLLRLGLIAQAVALAITLPASSRAPSLFAFASYLVLEMAWAVGTFNWGTSARHHIPASGLLLLAAFARPQRRTDQHGSLEPLVNAA